MSTSYIKIILFLAGIFIISSPAFSQTYSDADPTPEYLECSWAPYGVPAIVHLLDIAALDKKEKKAYLEDVLAEKKNHTCHEAGNSLSCSQGACPPGEYFLCAKNAQYNLDPNHPSILPNGTDSGCIELTSAELKRGLRKALEGHKSEFDLTRYGSCKNGEDCRTFSAVDDNDGKQHTYHVFSALGEYNIGFNLSAPIVPKHPEPPIPPKVDKPIPPAPPEAYANVPSDMNCGGPLDCNAAKNCESNPQRVFSETCMATNCANKTLAGCFKDYDAFCRASGGLCGSGLATNQVPPADMAVQTQAGIRAISDMKLATPGTDFNKCALFAILGITPKGQTSTVNDQYKEMYRKCVSGDSELQSKLAFQQLDLNYLAAVLKAFNDPGSYKKDKPFSTAHLKGLVTALSKLAGTDPKDAFKALGISNPTPEMTQAYNDLAKVAANLVGTTATESGMKGTVLGFAIATTGGQGYLGYTPVSQKDLAGGLGTYPQILASLNDKPSCMLTPAYTDKNNQDKYLKAIIHDYNVALAIQVGLKTCGANTKPGEANTKPSAGIKK